MSQASQALVLVRPAPPVIRPDRSESLLLEFAQDLRLRGLSRNTILGYVSDLRLFLRFLRRPLESATLTDLRAFGRSHLERHVTTSTWARRVGGLRSFFDWHRKCEGRTASIAQDLDVPRRGRHVHRFWTDAQVRQFRRRAFTDEPARLLSGRSQDAAHQARWTLADPRVVIARDRAIMELGLMGLRVSEVTGLNLEDLIDLERPDRAAVLVHRKADHEQWLPLTRDAQRALRRWVRVRNRHVPTPALFVRIPFQPRRPSRLNRASVAFLLKAYARKAGLPLPPHKAFHLLRHSCGQQMSELGMSVEIAQAYLGHADPKTTMIYYAVSDARLQKVARRFRY